MIWSQKLKLAKDVKVSRLDGKTLENKFGYCLLTSKCNCDFKQVFSK